MSSPPRSDLNDRNDLVNTQLFSQLNDAMSRGVNVVALPSLDARNKNEDESPVQQATRLSRLASRFGVELKLDVEIVVATTKKWYDEYVAPRDIPTVPNFLEPSFDKALWQVCEYGIRWAYRALNPKDVRDKGLAALPVAATPGNAKK